MTDLSYFYTTDENDNEVLRERTTKKLPALKVAIDNGASESDVVRFANGVVEDEQWQWYDKYTEYLAEYEAVELHNNDLPVLSVEADENGDDVTTHAEPKEFPTLDVRPAIRTGTDLLNSLSYYSDMFKLKRAETVKNITVEVDEMLFDGDEDSQNRMNRAIVGMNTASIETTKWKLATNDVVDVTASQLATAMLLAGEVMTNAWFDDA